MLSFCVNSQILFDIQVVMCDCQALTHPAFRLGVFHPELRASMCFREAFLLVAHLLYVRVEFSRPLLIFVTFFLSVSFPRATCFSHAHSFSDLSELPQ